MYKKSYSFAFTKFDVKNGYVKTILQQCLFDKVISDFLCLTLSILIAINYSHTG